MDDGVWTVRRLIEWTASFFSRKDVDGGRLSAELLLAHVLGVQRIKLYTDIDRAPGESQLAEYRALVRRAAEGEPVAYLTGKAPFFSLEFEVTRDVLIPRPDTEVLVERAIQLARSRRESGWDSPRVLDLCAGSGCVGAAIAAHLPGSHVWAVEISPTAAAVADRNIKRLGLSERITLLEGDLYAPLQDLQPFHLIVANPPYIPSSTIGTLDKGVRDYEPVMALDGGPDGLVFHRRIWEGAASRLVEGGQVLLEIAFDQGPAALAELGKCPPLAEGRLFKDYAGRDRVIAATAALR